MYMDPVEGCAETTFSDVDRAQGIELAKQFGHHSIASFASKLTYAAYKTIPVSYIFCEEDQTVPPQVQQAVIDMMSNESGKEVDVHTIKSGHCPNISQPENLVKIIRRAVGEEI